jgi:hypothetical protein
MHLGFMIDEYSDRSAPSEVRKQKNVVMAISAFDFVTMIGGLMIVTLSGFGEAYLGIRALRRLASVERVFLISPLI